MKLNYKILYKEYKKISRQEWYKPYSYTHFLQLFWNKTMTIEKILEIRRNKLNFDVELEKLDKYIKRRDKLEEAITSQILKIYTNFDNKK